LSGRVHRFDERDLAARNAATIAFMHIADGILSTPVWAALNAAAVPMIGLAVRRVRAANAPLLGVMGAFVFAAQRMNFPAGLGTSGHLLGGALLAMTLGPGAATIVLTAILILQTLVFQDGGVLALGANVMNMAILGVWAGWLPYRYFANGPWKRFGVFAGAFLSVLVSAAAALLELRFSGVALNGAIVTVSAAVFAVTALMEGLITVAVVQSAERLNPGWVDRPAARSNRVIGTLAAASIALMAVGVLFISPSPDGLESLLERAGAAPREQVLFAAPLADYEARFAEGDWGRKAVAGLAGLGMIYAMCVMLGRLLLRQRSA